MTLPAGLYAHVTTSEGPFTVKLFEEEAPNTVANFAGLAEGTKEWKDPVKGTPMTRPFYDGLIFHRVIDGFVIQGGCPTGNGSKTMPRTARYVRISRSRAGDVSCGA